MQIVQPRRCGRRGGSPRHLRRVRRGWRPACEYRRKVVGGEAPRGANLAAAKHPNVLPATTSRAPTARCGGQACSASTTRAARRRCRAAAWDVRERGRLRRSTTSLRKRARGSALDDWSWLPDGRRRPPPITGQVGARGAAARQDLPAAAAAAQLDRVLRQVEDGASTRSGCCASSSTTRRQQAAGAAVPALQAVESGQTEVATWELGKEGRGGRRRRGPRRTSRDNPDFNDAERVVGMQPQTEDLPPVYLVKWRGLPYPVHVGGARTLVHEQTAIRRYLARETPPTAQGAA